MTPQQAKGDQASADAGVQVALRLLERAMVAHGSDTPKGGAIMKCIHDLTKYFAHDEDRAQSIMPAELKSALMGGTGDAGTAAAPGGAGA